MLEELVAASAQQRISRERLIVRVRAGALAFMVVQTAIQPGDNVAVSWALVALLGLGTALTAGLAWAAGGSRAGAAGVAGMALDTAVVSGVLANNLENPTDPVSMIVIFLAVEAALRWGLAGGVAGGIGAGALAAAWGAVVHLAPGDWTVEYATIPLAIVAILGASMGALVGALNREREAIIRMAYLDQLTGLPNRRALNDHLARALGTPEPPGLLYIDLDGFKDVNDRLGHAVGDELLAAVAARLASVVRGDVDLARVGGDEFVAVVPGGGEPAVLQRVAHRAAGCFSDPFKVGGTTIAVGAAIGAVPARAGETPESALRRADAAMYSAKRTPPEFAR